MLSDPALALLGLPPYAKQRRAILDAIRDDGGANAHTLHASNGEVPMWQWYDTFHHMHAAGELTHSWKPVRDPKHFAAQLGWYELRGKPCEQ